MKFILTITIAFTLFSLTSCDSSEDKCRRHYIEKEGYSYDEACDQCEAEVDAENESRARR